MPINIDRVDGLSKDFTSRSFGPETHPFTDNLLRTSVYARQGKVRLGNVGARSRNGNIRSASPRLNYRRTR